MQIKVGYSACVNKPWATSGLVGCWLQIFKSAKGNFLQSFQTAKTMSLCKNYGEFHLYLFPFDFPFNYIAKLVSSGISSKYLDMACYLKQETYSGLISFEVQQNDIWTDKMQSFEMPF